MSVDSESLGAQFLRDVPEQDNFEASPWGESHSHAEGLEKRVSQATLETAEQDDGDVLESRSLIHDATEQAEEPAEDLDLLSNSIRQASLFDHPTSRGGTRSARVHADESTHLHARNEKARDKAERAARARLRRRRSPGW